MLTGKEFLESLKDGRKVYLYGEEIDDVTTHPAFRNAARSYARLYDSLHDPELSKKIVTENEYGDKTHRFFKTPKSSGDLFKARDAIAEWSKLNYGFMGRTPDYKATFVGHLQGYADFFEGFEDNAKEWYRKVSKDVSFVNHTIINPQVDRSKPLHENKDVFVRVVNERDDGIIVSGAKMVGTSSPLTHYTFVGNYGPKDLGDGDQSHALMFMMSMNAPGLKMISRPSYELMAATTGTPFDYPLSSRFDENDAVIVLDNVFIPWEDVLAYKNIEVSNNFVPGTHFVNRFSLHGGTRLAVKLDFMAGLLLKATEGAGTKQFRGVQVNVGEVLALRNMMWSLTTAMVSEPDVGMNGLAIPNSFASHAYRVLAPETWVRVKNIFKQVVAGGLIQLPSSSKDFLNEDLKPYIDKYYRGTGISAEERVKLLKLVWDSIGTEFGGRHELYEINYAGNTENVRLETLKHAEASGAADTYKAFADSAMSDYDLHGWTNSTWINEVEESSALK
ncbi:4-hydroxyphenylacetate 3-hydroxylase family protein [Salicibibacter kimchii]|uniref:Pyoverdin chromophore biosynthetic protein pvcC n=1 Tax=Salicibibacter kimchii TaxID=2099786 RepID=A0A345C0N4_9BACI|nr:4-hydroxyphenylacetate 3-hydroxylase family protein [Salicibibacter kimchii]AXF56765.1 Pyoverdin chromophore biosynthetic protein pvcC [Salicibibacter kimchii]